MSYLAVGQHFPRREAAEALKARNIPAQGKHAESVRRPGYNGDYVRVPRPLWPQSAKLTGAKGAMELTCLPGIDIGGMSGRHSQWVTDYHVWTFEQSLIPAQAHQNAPRTPISQPWSRAPVSQPWCGLSARAVARGQQASIRAPGIPTVVRAFSPRRRKRPESVHSRFQRMNANRMMARGRATKKAAGTTLING